MTEIEGVVKGVREKRSGTKSLEKIKNEDPEEGHVRKHSSSSSLTEPPVYSRSSSSANVILIFAIAAFISFSLCSLFLCCSPNFAPA